MKRSLRYLIAAISIWVVTAPPSQAQVILPASKSVLDFRKVGELRYWTFVVRDSAIGGLASIVEEPQEIDGQTAIVLKQKLSLDYTKVGQDRKVDIEGKFFVSKDGHYLGDSKKISFGGAAESLELRRKGDSVSGYFTRGGKPVDRSAHIESDAFGLDANFIDELEIALASSKLEVGQPIDCHLFEPQSLLSSQLNGFVEDFRYTGIYQNKYDSVFTINLFTPRNMYVLMTRDKRIVKVDFPDERTKVYLDVVREQPKEAPEPSSRLGLLQFIQLTPNYLVYLLVSVVAVLLFIGRGYRWKVTYVGYVAAAISFWLMVYTQFPLQDWLFQAVFIPSVRAGGSIYLASILPALPVGLFQSLTCFGLLVLVQRLSHCKEYQLVALGAVLGAGFGLMEACYLDSIAVRTGFDFGFLERAAIIVYHGAAVALIGYLWGNARRLIAGALGLLVIINAFFRYMPVFVQSSALSVGAAAILIAVIAFVCQGVALVVIKQKLLRSKAARVPVEEDSQT